jgi:hypothetical protein
MTEKANKISHLHFRLKSKTIEKSNTYLHYATTPYKDRTLFLPLIAASLLLGRYVISSDVPPR